MPNPVLTSAIDALASREDLSEQRTAEVLAEIMHGDVSEVQIAGFLIALRTKGETVQELAGLARTMRELAAHVPTTREDLLDTAGTGGGRRTFNVSTTAALIAAGAGCAVAKHGNRSATSPSGSADLLEALGARIDLAPEAVARCIEEAGFGFMFAPAHHQATRFVIPVRRGAGGADDLQPAGAADEPGGRDAPADRRLRRALPGDGRGRARAARRRARARRLRRGRPRRGLDRGPDPRRGGHSAGACAATRSTPRRSGFAALPTQPIRRSRAARRPRTPTSPARSWRARPPAAARDLALINAGAAIYAAGVAATLAEGVRGGARRDRRRARGAGAGALRGGEPAARAGESRRETHRRERR